MCYRYRMLLSNKRLSNRPIAKLQEKLMSTLKCKLSLIFLLNCLQFPFTIRQTFSWEIISNHKRCYFSAILMCSSLRTPKRGSPLLISFSNVQLVRFTNLVSLFRKALHSQLARSYNWGLFLWVSLTLFLFVNILECWYLFSIHFWRFSPMSCFRVPYLNGLAFQKRCQPLPHRFRWIWRNPSPFLQLLVTRAIPLNVTAVGRPPGSNACGCYVHTPFQKRWMPSR